MIRVHVGKIESDYHVRRHPVKLVVLQKHVLVNIKLTLFILEVWQQMRALSASTAGRIKLGMALTSLYQRFEELGDKMTMLSRTFEQSVPVGWLAQSAIARGWSFEQRLAAEDGARTVNRPSLGVGTNARSASCAVVAV
jgi:hypothetical protein